MALAKMFPSLNRNFSLGVVDGHDGFTDTLFGQEVFYDSLPPPQMVAMLEAVGFDIFLAEMCDAPDGGSNKGKWATVVSRNAQSYRQKLDEAPNESSTPKAGAEPVLNVAKR